METIDKIVSKLVSEFENKPIATTLKGVVIIWVLKHIKSWWTK